ncbi:ATP-dependent endonuclease [Amycolatopsis sp. NPDC049252]|uniref:ATP-dependent nuclease n=1 Tax=Amycolatopsis sp. NPDC049252 TaxID=3363933 RepID=UPI00371DBF9E
MKLTSFRVRRYKNVIDSTLVSMEQDVTALVGMNESGKSTMLYALYRLNPVYGDEFIERDDYPRWRWKRDGRKENLSVVTPIEATFRLGQADLDALRDALGEGVCAPDTVTIGRHYNGGSWVAITVDTARFLKNVLDGHPDAKELLAVHDTVASLKGALSDLAVTETAERAEGEGPSEGVQNDQRAPSADALERISSQLGAKEDLGAIARTIAISRMPRFFRFASYQNLEGRVDVATLRTQENEEPGASSKQTARALLRLADTDIDSITDDEFESRTAELEAVSSDLSREMAEYWSTNPELRIRVEIEPETVRHPNGQMTVARFLNFRVEDRKHDFTNNFSLRSSGYQWFFSFLAAFSEFEGSDGDVVILLDEPALTLHAKAQQDFLRFINDRLAPVGQVLYTTHSPFMVEEIERVRVVEDRGGDVGSVTTSDALEVGEDSAFPLQAALGYDLSQNLFIGERNLLVEGPSDLAYLEVISRHLRDEGREGLDEKWRILPAGGVSNVPTFVALLGRKISVTVLLDSGTEGGGKVEAAIKANKIASKRVVFVGSVLTQKHSDIEDLFTAGDYLGLYNDAFGASHKVGDLPKHPDRLILRLEALDGKFDHWRPAEVLLRNPAKVAKLSQTTLDNFENLARSINETHS